MQRPVPGDIVAANLSAFNRSSPAARRRILSAIEDLARALVARGRIDYPEQAVADAASLLWGSAVLDQQAFVRSSATLLPFLLQSQREPASPLIAAAFPSVYQELKKADGPPDFFEFFLFDDWDKCKIARRDSSTFSFTQLESDGHCAGCGTRAGSRADSRVHRKAGRWRA